MDAHTPVHVWKVLTGLSGLFKNRRKEDMQLGGMCCGDSGGSWKGEMGSEYDLFHTNKYEILKKK